VPEESALLSNPTPLVICSKSRWTPAIRREHSLAMLAAARGHPVTFVERPLDVRALCRIGSARDWWRGLSGMPRTLPSPLDVRVVRSSAILPGHLSDLSQATSNLLLRRLLARAPENAAIVVNVPWQWPAVGSLGARRVFDCADDWTTLIAHRGERLRDLHRRIGREADAIIVADPSLASQFPADRTVVVRNGVSDDMLGPLAPVPRAPRLVHVGTLSPRFDATLAAGLLDKLPDWSMDLYGQCQYPGAQERPGSELSQLLSDYAPRLRWHGVLPRHALSVAIDRAAVALVLNRLEHSSGQDSMKLYDYAARGRPIVTTRFSARLEQDGPPHLSVVDDARQMAAAIVDSRNEPGSWADDRRSWAEEQRWTSRWPMWSAAVFGVAP
jgi:hypothetical protein